jgi:glycosyltransferase involved in cell wall biosynthesis
MGLVVGYTIRELARMPGVALTIGLIKAPIPADRIDERLMPPARVPRAFDVVRAPFGRLDLVRALVGGPLFAKEREVLEGMRAAAAEVEAVLWIGSAWDPLVRVVPRHCAGRPVILHCNDSISLFETQRGSRWREPLARRHELRVLSAGYAGTVLVSHVDAERARSLAPGKLAESVITLPNGVDVERFAPVGEDAVDARDRSTAKILFTGVMNYGPNVEAASYLVHEVCRELRQPFALRLAGRDPSPAVQALARAHTSVTVTGAVASMSTEYQTADVLAVPMRQATGTKNKVLEALACGLPVVTTAGVMDAFGYVLPGVIVADSAVDFARAIERVVQDRDYRAALSEQGRRHMLSEWSWSARTSRLLAAIAGRVETSA